MSFVDCRDCDATTRERHEEDGLCRACYALRHPDEVETAEVPIEVLRRLSGMAQTRHPSVCNEEAFDFEVTLSQQIEGYSHNRGELGDDH
jgi:hypothetical protein